MVIAQVLLIVDEHDAVKNRASLISAAQQLGKVSLFVIGQSDDVESLQNAEGIEAIYWLDSSDQHFSTEDIMSTLMPYITDADHILSSTEILGRNLLPRLAGRFQELIVTNVIDIQKDDQYCVLKRPAFMGSICETLQIPAALRCFLTIQAARFPAVKKGSHTVSISKVAFTPSAHQIQIDPVISSEHNVSLTDADIVVGCGLGTKNVTDIEKLVHNLNTIGTTAVGVTRLLVDHEMATSDMLIGQTGKNISPRLYLALGISGASQHICGIVNAQKIIAVNKDPEAPIFRVADYALIADLKDVISKLIYHLSEKS